MGLFRSGKSDPDTDYVCRKCKEEVHKDAERCPHCGYEPKDERKSAAYKLGATITSLTPVGWYMWGRSISGDLKSMKGIAEEKEVEDETPEHEKSSPPPVEEKDTSEMDEYQRKIYEAVRGESDK